jgi:site-specific DNA-cytosine methylase
MTSYLQNTGFLKTLMSLELFAGAGELALGMHAAGFEIVDLVEFKRSVLCNATR